MRALFLIPMGARLLQERICREDGIFGTDRSKPWRNTHRDGREIPAAPLVLGGVEGRVMGADEDDVLGVSGAANATGGVHGWLRGYVLRAGWV